MFIVVSYRPKLSPASQIVEEKGVIHEIFLEEALLLYDNEICVSRDYSADNNNKILSFLLSLRAPPTSKLYTHFTHQAKRPLWVTRGGDFAACLSESLPGPSLPLFAKKRTEYQHHDYNINSSSPSGKN